MLYEHFVVIIMIIVSAVCMWKELELETVRENKRETESAYAFICAGLMYESMHD